MAKEITEEVKKEKETFDKESLLKCSKYFNRKDLLNTLLKNDVKYTFEEVDKLIDEFMKGEVK